MATKKSEHTPLLILNIQHEFISLKTPNGTFTTSYRGARASGKLASHPTAFHELDKFVQNLPKGSNYGQRMAELLNPKILEVMWPQWNEKKNVIEIGDTVTFNEPIFKKKYPNSGVVKSIKRNTAYVQFPDVNTHIGFDMSFLEKTK